MNVITKALYYLAITFITFQFSATHALNPLFDEVNYPDNLHTKSKTSQARFMFRMAHQLDMVAIKSLYLKGEKDDALRLLSKAKLIYTKASALCPDNPMIKIFAEAHDYLRPDGSIVRGSKDAKLALSNLYDDDTNETPIDPDMKAFWLGKGLKIEKDHDSRIEVAHSHGNKSVDKEEADDGEKTTSVVDGRMASLFVLGAATGAGGLEMGKYLTENVALQYLSGGGGFVVGFIAYVIAIKTMTCISTNRTQSKEAQKTAELLSRIEGLLDKKSSSYRLIEEDNDQTCISCNCPRPSCWCMKRLFCCCCCHTKMSYARPEDEHFGYIGSSENPLYASPQLGSHNPLFDRSSPQHEQDTPLSSLHSLQLTNDNELKELTEIYQERLVQYGPDDPFVQAFCIQTKEIRQEASDTLTKKYTPPNSEETSANDATEIDPDRPDHIAIDINDFDSDVGSAVTEMSAQENMQ